MSEAACAYCGQPFTRKREHGVYCSASCRARARRTAQAAPTMPLARVRTGAEPSKLQDRGDGGPATVTAPASEEPPAAFPTLTPPAEVQVLTPPPTPLSLACEFHSDDGPSPSCVWCLQIARARTA